MHIFRQMHILSCLLLLIFCEIQAFNTRRPSNVNIAVTISTRRHSTEKKRTANRTFAMYATSTWQENVGNSALRNVKSLAQSVNRANQANDKRQTGDTASIFNNIQEQRGIKGQNRQVVLGALESLERDMQLLDNITAEKPQLSRLEITILSLCVLSASSGPLFTDGAKIAEVLSPAAAALSAAIGIGAEYTGKVAVADGKEVAASTLQCAAEAEGLLAKAERVKAVSPLCVGISATAATFSLLAPVLVEFFNGATGGTVVTEIYLLSPLVAVLAAAVASLSLQETQAFVSRAISVGNRRFAKSGLVGRTWLRYVLHTYIVISIICHVIFII